jgi:hypothetical protein
MIQETKIKHFKTTKHYIYIIGKCLVAWLVDHLLLKDFGPYGIIFISMFAFTTLDFPDILDGQFTSHVITG